MSKSIALILGHPAKNRLTFCESLANAYMTGARNAGHDVHLIKLSDMDFDPILHEGFHGIQDLESDVDKASEIMRTASHWVFIYPLWQFMIPALLKGFLERVLTKKFALGVYDNQDAAKDKNAGKSARIIQTMGMPNFVYRYWFGAHGAMSLISVLKFMDIAPVEITYCGLAENPNDARRQAYLEKVRNLGRLGI